MTNSLELSQYQPQTFYIDYDVKSKETSLIPITRGIDGAPAKPDFRFPANNMPPINNQPPSPFTPPPTPPADPHSGYSSRDPYGVYITSGTADVDGVHPALLGSSGYHGVVGGVMAVMDGVEVLQPVYDLVAIQNYLTCNAWHYAAVKAKATAATELGYTWVYDKKNQEGIISSNTNVLTEFEDRIYERNHKDLATILRDQAMDYFSTGNQAIEVAYTMGGKVDCLYAVPAITIFRHPVYPVAVQALPDYERWSSIFDQNSPAKNSLDVKAILPLFMSGLSKTDLMQLFPDANHDVMTNNELVHVTNAVISTDPFYGVADILPALSAMMGDNAANDYNWQFFENNAIPRYAVTIAGGKVNEEVANQIRDFFNKEIQGRAHRTVVIPLPRDMTATFQALDATQNDASFIQFKKLNREEIAAVHSIPPSEIGLWESANKANSNQQARNYFRKVIQPYQAKVEAMMTRIIQHGLGISGVKFKFKNVEYTDDQERATVAYTKAQAFRQYVDGISNILKTLNELAGSGGSSSGGGGKNPVNNNNSLSSSGRSVEDNNGLVEFEDIQLVSSQEGDKSKEKGTAPSKGDPKAKEPSKANPAGTGTNNPAPTIIQPPKPDPILSAKEVKPLVKQLIQQAMDAREIFELDSLVESYE